MSDLIERQAAIDAVENCEPGEEPFMIKSLPSAQPEGIPLVWIDKYLEWLDNCDNGFVQFAKVSIREMVEIWKKDRI